MGGGAGGEGVGVGGRGGGGWGGGFTAHVRVARSSMEKNPAF